MEGYHGAERRLHSGMRRSKAAALGMAFKLLKAAEERWRRFNGHELVGDVLAGARFKDGIRVPDGHPTHDEKVAA